MPFDVDREVFAAIRAEGAALVAAALAVACAAVLVAVALS